MNKNKMLMDDNSIDELCRQAYGLDKESLEEEIKRAESDGSIPELKPPEGEFNIIMTKINERGIIPLGSKTENTEKTGVENNTNRRKIRSLKKMGKLMAIAATICIIMLVFAIGVSAKKYYDYRVNSRFEHTGRMIYNNDERVMGVGSIGEAYETIRQELEVQPLRAGYLPKDTEFEDMTIGLGHARIDLLWKEQYIYLYVVKYDQDNSDTRHSERQQEGEIYNDNLKSAFTVESYETFPGEKEYSAHIELQGVRYTIAGMIPYEEFEKIVEKCMIY